MPAENKAQKPTCPQCAVNKGPTGPMVRLTQSINCSVQSVDLIASSSRRNVARNVNWWCALCATVRLSIDAATGLKYTPTK